MNLQELTCQIEGWGWPQLICLASANLEREVDVPYSSLLAFMYQGLQHSQVQTKMVVMTLVEPEGLGGSSKARLISSSAVMQGVDSGSSSDTKVVHGQVLSEQFFGER